LEKKLVLRARSSFLLLVPLFLLEEFIDELDDGKLEAPHRCLLSIENWKKTMQRIFERHYVAFARAPHPFDPWV
jgi:hypothetical protein